MAALQFSLDKSSWKKFQKLFANQLFGTEFESKLSKKIIEEFTSKEFDEFGRVYII